ncbi:MAG: 16S rRNA (guanine(966)-N(2))-methyltransferase RsmD [Xanthomonadales bacterium]|nr:16S rRNA (guanine(966)-N(2))-methyltransferase RsmD [Xanthomonadales bacterium]
MMAKSNKTGTVRIIAGDWRGRRLPVPDLPGLRPSGDRSRETLFNWLQADLRGAQCLDLFAGTGVLGLEAVSRGASSAVLVEKNHSAAEQLRENVNMLAASQVSVVQSDALLWLQGQAADSFDLVFIDPPFGQGLTMLALQALSSGQQLRADGLVYLETARSEVVPAFSSDWEILREKTLGEVRMQLVRASRTSKPDRLLE